MSGKWRDDGIVPNYQHDIPDMFLPTSMQTDSHKVTNTETGEERRVRVGPGQTVGEAIANGQWDD